MLRFCDLCCGKAQKPEMRIILRKKTNRLSPASCNRPRCSEAGQLQAKPRRCLCPEKWRHRFFLDRQFTRTPPFASTRIALLRLLFIVNMATEYRSICFPRMCKSGVEFWFLCAKRGTTPSI
jgi:hypothetical protein